LFLRSDKISIIYGGAEQTGYLCVIHDYSPVNILGRQTVAGGRIQPSRQYIHIRCPMSDEDKDGSGGRSGRGRHGKTAPEGQPWRREGNPGPARPDDGSAAHLALLAPLGLEGVIDAHCHWFPDNVTEKIWEYFSRHYWPVTYHCSGGERLRWLRQNRVDGFTTLNYAHRPGMASWLNRWTAQWAGDTPGAILTGTFYPEEGVGEYVEEAIGRLGMRGFKLHLRVSAFDPACAELTPAFERVQEAGLPVVIHCGSAPDPSRFNEPGAADRLLKRYPRLKLVVAHMGAWEWEHYLGLAERFEHVYLDTTMVFVDFPACGRFPGQLLGRLEGLSAKILFGSDFPNIPYPLSHAVESVVSLPLSAEARRGILYGNAIRLFGLDVSGGKP